MYNDGVVFYDAKSSVARSPHRYRQRPPSRPPIPRRSSMQEARKEASLEKEREESIESPRNLTARIRAWGGRTVASFRRRRHDSSNTGPSAIGSAMSAAPVQQVFVHDLALIHPSVSILVPRSYSLALF